MNISPEQSLQRSQCIHPRAEPEIAFKLSQDIVGALSVDEVVNYVDGVAAVEVIDSRYENFKFSLEDVVADNCSSCGYAMGPWCKVQGSSWVEWFRYGPILRRRHHRRRK